MAAVSSPFRVSVRDVADPGLLGVVEEAHQGDLRGVHALHHGQDGADDPDPERVLLTALRLLQERGERVTVPALALVCAEIEGSDLPAARSAKPFSSVPIALAKVHRRAEAVEGLDIEALSKLAPAADDVFEEIAAGYEEAVKRFRAAKKQAAAERKKREKSSAKARGRKRGRGRGEGQGSVPAGYVSFPDGATTRRTPS